MVYEKLLNEGYRDANVEAARKDPVPWRVAGSLEFMEMLHKKGLRNYFITGAVVTFDENGTTLTFIAPPQESQGCPVFFVPTKDNPRRRDSPTAKRVFIAEMFLLGHSGPVYHVLAKEH
jgi:hypothetical protein